VRLLHQETKPDILVAVVSCAAHKNPLNTEKLKRFSVQYSAISEKILLLGRFPGFAPLSF
jgi:hypothetical protein